MGGGGVGGVGGGGVGGEGVLGNFIYRHRTWLHDVVDISVIHIARYAIVKSKHFRI